MNRLGLVTLLSLFLGVWSSGLQDGHQDVAVTLNQFVSFDSRSCDAHLETLRAWFNNLKILLPDDQDGGNSPWDDRSLMQALFDVPQNYPSDSEYIRDILTHFNLARDFVWRPEPVPESHTSDEETSDDGDTSDAGSSSSGSSSGRLSSLGTSPLPPIIFCDDKAFTFDDSERDESEPNAYHVNLHGIRWKSNKPRNLQGLANVVGQPTSRHDTRLCHEGGQLTFGLANRNGEPIFLFCPDMFKLKRSKAEIAKLTGWDYRLDIVEDYKPPSPEEVSQRQGENKLWISDEIPACLQLLRMIFWVSSAGLGSDLGLGSQPNPEAAMVGDRTLDQLSQNLDEQSYNNVPLRNAQNYALAALARLLAEYKPTRVPDYVDPRFPKKEEEPEPTIPISFLLGWLSTHSTAERTLSDRALDNENQQLLKSKAYPNGRGEQPVAGPSNPRGGRGARRMF